MATKMLVRYRTKKLKSPEEIQDFSLHGHQTGHHLLFLFPCCSAIPACYIQSVYKAGLINP
jgi:hypothetical protein